MSRSNLLCLLLLPFFLLISTAVKAHSCKWKTVACPLDGTEVSFCVTQSMYTEGQKKDMQKYGAIGTFYEELVNSCPTCYFSGYVEDFEKEYTEEEKSDLQAYLKTNSSEPKDEADEYAIYAGIQELQNDSPQAIADSWLKGSYMLKGFSKLDKKRKKMQLQAACFFEEAIEINSCVDEVQCAIYKYLIAEMYRRADFFLVAQHWYEKAKKDPYLPEWVREMNYEQQKLAVKNDNRNDV